MNNKPFALHSAAISLIFVLGNFIIIFPTAKADEYTFFAFLISLIILAVVFLASAFFWEKIKKSDIIYKISVGLVSVFSLFAAAKAFRDIANFLAVIVLPRTSRFFIVSLLGAVVIYFSLKKQENTLKFSLLAGVMVLGIIAFFLIAAWGNYNERNIYIFNLPTLANGIEQIKPYVEGPVIEVVLLPLYLSLTVRNYNKKTAFSGAVIGGCILGLCILSCILLFGVETAAALDFPFSSVVSTVSVGRLFTRLDGLVYFVNFICSVIKITICLYIPIASLKKLRGPR